MDPKDPQRHTRRQFLRSLTVGGGTLLLAACGGAAGTTPTTAPTAAAPTTAPTTAAPTAAATTAATAAPTAAASAAEGVIRSGVEGVPDAYTSAPQPFKSVEGIPGTGGKVRAFTISFGPPASPRDQNDYQKELEKRLGVTWESIPGAADSYSEKASALVASGDLPEFFYIFTGAAPQLLQAINQGAFTDLTPYLSGDAIKEYPNLARYPAYLWTNVAVAGKIYGIPKWTGGRFSTIPFYRKDWADKLGMAAAPKNADDVYKLLVAFSKNDPDGNGQADTYGMGSYGDFDQALIRPMFRVPNQWRKNNDGTLTYYLETPEYRQAVEFQRKLWEGGGYHPDSPTMTFSQYADGFIGGKIGLHTQGFSNFFGLNGMGETIAKNLSGNVDGMLPPGHDGGAAVTHNGLGFFGFTAIPATVGQDQARVRELLRIANYLAAPPYSEEGLFLDNGIEGVHHTVEADGSRKGNDKLGAESSFLAYQFRPEGTAYYFPGLPGEAERAQKLAEASAKLGIDNPVQTLYSATDAARGSELRQLNNDRLMAIVTGREPLDALETWIADWRSRGGDQIRQEYEQALRG